MSLCVSILVGRVTKDMTIKYSQSDNPLAVATVDLAVDVGFGKKKKTNYFKLKAFGKTAENMAKLVKKGAKIIVRCEPTQERWKKDDQMHVIEYHYVQTWEFAESKKFAEQNAEQEMDYADSVPESKPEAPTSNQPWMDIPDDVGDNLPFL